MMRGDGGLVLVVGSGGQPYRQYLLAGAAERRPLWLLDAAQSTWQRAHVHGTSVVPLIDGTRLIPDRKRLIDAAAQVAAKRGVAGVFSYDETLVMATAEIAEQFGLPGLTVDGA